MKKLLLSAISLLILVTPLAADEGMWMIHLLDKQLVELMKSKGLVLKPGEIYNPAEGGLTDAIVAIDGGSCSGSIISPNGLMITNHHCAYSDIHALSTPRQNYLENGFWAMSIDQEVPIKGKSVTFLRGVLNVTQEVNNIIDSLDAAGPRGLFFMNKVSSIIEKRFESLSYEKGLSSMWRGSEYYLYLFETFKDVRLVGAPAASIGSFGGETDNWGWPQHKGDFAIYRVYAGEDGRPAEYSSQNRPLQAKRYLTISERGINEGDFAMIIGYPGRTNRYTSSYELNEKYSILNPIISGVRRAKLEVWKSHMDRSDEIRLMYSDKYFGISNYTDYAKWENICIKRFDIIAKLKEREERLQTWIESNNERREKYGDILSNLEKAYRIKAGISREREFFRESMVRGSEFMGLGQRFQGLSSSLSRAGKVSFTREDKEVSNFYDIAKKTFKESCPNVDRDLFKVMIRYYLNEVPKSFYDSSFIKLVERFKGESDKLVDFIYDNSIITSEERLDNFFAQERELNEILADPIMDVVKTIGIREYNRKEESLLEQANLDPSKDRGRYVKALYEMQKENGESIYPDANSTMRLTFGTVGGIKPRDAVFYNYRTTSDGILQKADPNNYEFRITKDLEEALKTRDWGRWGESGVLYVNFMTDNDITGGNSGSAVMNGKGELIGLAFDGNRESMAGDAYFVEGYNKSVSVDIRYVLWVVERYAGATHILKELTITK